MAFAYRFFPHVASLLLAGGFVHGSVASSAAEPELAIGSQGRLCIASPHEPGRMRRMVGQAVTTAQPWAYHPTTDQHPRCRNIGPEEAYRATFGDG